MNTLNQKWREASALEAKQYWEIVDEIDQIMHDARKSRDKRLMELAFECKRDMTDLLHRIGYVVNEEGLFLKHEPDVLDDLEKLSDIDQAAVNLGMSLALTVMRHGPVY